jgi:hypothetical protein
LRNVVEDLLGGFVEERLEQDSGRYDLTAKLKEKVAGDRFGGMVR